MSRAWMILVFLRSSSMVNLNMAPDPLVVNGSVSKTRWSQTWKLVTCNPMNWSPTQIDNRGRPCTKIKYPPSRTTAYKRCRTSTPNASSVINYHLTAASRATPAVVCASRIGLFSHRRTHTISWSWDLSHRRLSPSQSNCIEMDWSRKLQSSPGFLIIIMTKPIAAVNTATLGRKFAKVMVNAT